MSKVFVFVFQLSSLISLSLLTSAAANAPSTRPDPLKHLRLEHPRLLASSNDFAALRARLTKDPDLSAQHERIRASAVKLLTEPPSKYEIPDGLRLLATSRRVLNRVMTLGFLYQIDHDTRYVDRAWQELDAAAHFPNWNPRHFLDTAEMAHAFAIGYDWMFDAWSPEQRQILTNAIIQMGLNQALPLYRQHKSWTVNHFNWNQVCNGGIGMGALAIADEQPALAREILDASFESLPLAMSEFAPDGAWKEGPGYWNYSTIYNVVYLAGLKSALGSDFGLSKIPGFSEAGMFPIYMSSPSGRAFNYADASEHVGHAPQLFWLASRFKRPEYAAFAEDGSPFGPWDLLWFKGAVGKAALTKLPLDKHFRNAEVATLRGSWTDKDAAFVGFKCGDNKAGHSHLDLGSFIYDALGVRWVTELGSDDYNLPSYFGRLRWNYYRLRAEGHNTLVLNPGEGPDQDPSAKVEVQKFTSKPTKAFAIADLTPAYAKSATKVKRGIALLNRRDLLVQDEMQLPAETEVWSFLHTPAEVTIDEGGRSASLILKGKKLQARLLSPSNARFSVMDAKPLPTSPQPPKQGDNSSVRKLAVHLRASGDISIAVLLTPEGKSETARTSELRPLAQW